MEESESRAYAESVVETFVGRSPKHMVLLSSGYGPLGWSQNRIFRADFSTGDGPSLVIKVGDGPMADFTVGKEIGLFEKVLPRAHPNLPVIYKTSHAPTPYILMEHLSPVPLLANYKDIARELIQELAVIMPSILLASTPEKSSIELHDANNAQDIYTTLSYGNLNLRNLGRRFDGTLVIFDWDGACRAPLGLDFKLFREHACFADIMRVFHQQCLNCGVNLPSAEVWHKRLIEIWDK